MFKSFVNESPKTIFKLHKIFLKQDFLFKSMGIGDWFLARSTAFRLLVDKFKQHKVNIKRSFTKIKSRHNAYEYILEGHEARLRELEGIISSLKETPTKIIKKKR